MSIAIMNNNNDNSNNNNNDDVKDEIALRKSHVEFLKTIF